MLRIDSSKFELLFAGPTGVAGLVLEEFSSRDVAIGDCRCDPVVTPCLREGIDPEFWIAFLGDFSGFASEVRFLGEYLEPF